MSLNTQVQRIQEEIYEELERPSRISPSFIGNWVITNAGAINALIGTSYSGVADSGICPPLEDDELAITKKLFQNYYYQREIKSNLGANGYTISEISEGDSKIKVVNKSDVAKNLQILQKEVRQEIKEMATAYRIKGASPREAAQSGIWSEDYLYYYNDY